VVKVQLHSAADASPLTALLLPQIFPMLAICFTQVTPTCCGDVINADAHVE
jgi:hypothetical protein